MHDLDRLFILLPPCVDELNAGYEALLNDSDPRAAEIKTTLAYIAELVELNLLNGEIAEDLSSGQHWNERKLQWLSKVRKILSDTERIVFGFAIIHCCVVVHL